MIPWLVRLRTLKLRTTIVGIVVIQTYIIYRCDIIPGFVRLRTLEPRATIVGIWNLERVKVDGFKCIQVHSKQGNFWKKETIILYLYVSLNTILSTDIYVALEQELCLWSRFE